MSVGGCIGADIGFAASLLLQGKLVAFPTETVYGLGADAANPQAVGAIFTAKNRPAEHPLIVHLPAAGHVDDWARDIPDAARLLMDAFWPGPLTLLLKRNATVIDRVTGGQGSVGLRVPGHPLALDLLRTLARCTERVGVAAPSANRFGRISPTQANHVAEELGDSVAYILDGGACPVGIESTIIDFTSGRPCLIRPGIIIASEIERICGMMLEQPGQGAPRASGTLAAHYAPGTPLYIVPSSELAAVISAVQQRGQCVALISFSQKRWSAVRYWMQLPDAAELYAQRLYAALRALDNSGAEIILVEAPPQTAEWVAVNDRLKRSAAGSQSGVIL